MKLAELSQKPQLIKIQIDEEHIIEKYGEALEFFIYDRQPLDVFSKLANAKQDDFSGAAMLLKDLILNEDGSKVIDEDHVLPMDVLIEAIKLIGERLGK
jgi:hypothetical protein